MPSRRRILRELDGLEGPIARAFAEAVRRIRSRARLDQLVAAIQAGDIERAFRAAGIREGSWGLVTEEVRNAYAAGGELYAADAPARFGFEFNMSNPRAERWLRDNSSRLITLINNEQREAIRGTIETGLRLGQGMDTTARDIIGRFDRKKGMREGGIVGLNSNQARAANRAREELLSGDPEQMRRYLSRKRRDRRFDGIVSRAIEDGKPVARADVDRLVGRYSDRLLQTRGEAIARSESLSALNEAADESLRQAVDEELIQAQNITRVWKTFRDGRERDSHNAMHDQPVGLDEPFTSGAGWQMMHPGDSSLGAPAEETINCRCTIEQQVDWLAE